MPFYKDLLSDNFKFFPHLFIDLAQMGSTATDFLFVSQIVNDIFSGDIRIQRFAANLLPFIGMNRCCSLYFLSSFQFFFSFAKKFTLREITLFTGMAKSLKEGQTKFLLKDFNSFFQLELGRFEILDSGFLTLILFSKVRIY